MKILFEEIMGETSYSLFSEQIKKDGTERTAFGIEVHKPGESAKVHDITTIRSKAEDVYDAMVRNAVTPIHLKHTIENLILQ